MADEMLKVAIVGGTGDGGLQPGTLMTPVGQPNVAVEIVAPMVAIVIRSVNVYLTLFLGLVTAGMTTDVLPITDFWSLVVLSAKLSVAGTVVNFVKDLITVFSNLEKRYPLLTGNV